MAYWGWKPYVSIADRMRKAEKAAAKAKKAGAQFSPVVATRGAIAGTFWGKAWCSNLERYSDYANRLPRGRAYVRNGSVVDLKIAAGEVRAQVMGSRLYKVEVKVAGVPGKQWQAIGADCAGSIDSLVELLQGKFSKAVMERICKPGIGLFPAPREIQFSCSCPDWAAMCKHVAAVLYGVGARLDQQPDLLFSLRLVDPRDLIARAGAGLSNLRKSAKKDPADKQRLDDAALADVFGIEMAEPAPMTKPGTRRVKSTYAATAGARPGSESGSIKKTVVKNKAKRQLKTETPTKSRPAVSHQPVDQGVVRKTKVKTTATDDKAAKALEFRATTASATPATTPRRPRR